MRSWLTGLAVVALISGAPPTFAQDAATGQEEDRVDDIVVVARRAGAPMWTVERGESTVILVGTIGGVPRDFVWRPQALEEATLRSQRILYPTEGRASMSDVFRLLWRIRTIATLPDGKTTADYLPAALQARVERLMQGEGDSWRKASLISLARDLMEQGGQQRGGVSAVDAVRRAARTADVPGQPVGFVRGDEMVEGLISDPPEHYVPCVAAAVAAAEAGEGGALQRLEAWRALRVADVLATPLDQALNLCWPSGDPEIAPQLRTQWREAAQTALSQPGVTMGVTNLRLLAEPGGVLDQLEAEGLEVRGPDWKPTD